MEDRTRETMDKIAQNAVQVCQDLEQAVEEARPIEEIRQIADLHRKLHKELDDLWAQNDPQGWERARKELHQTIRES